MAAQARSLAGSSPGQQNGCRSSRQWPLERLDILSVTPRDRMLSARADILPLERANLLSTAPLAQLRSARVRPPFGFGHIWSLERGFEWEEGTVSSPIIMVWCGKECMGF